MVGLAEWRTKNFMATTEHTINDALADLLRHTRFAWRDSKVITSENTGMIKDSNERPDILVLEKNVSPVVIETELLPAATVEFEAISRLGKKLRNNDKFILSSIAIRLPVRLKQVQGKFLRGALQEAQDIEMVFYTGRDAESCQRYPTEGWMVGNLATLSLLVQYASIPPSVIDEAAENLIDGVNEAATLIEEMALDHPSAIQNIAQQLHQEDGLQTRRMAATILANAFIFHASLAGMADELGAVKSLAQLKFSNEGINTFNVLEEWQKILKVNYWPIFDIARRILVLIPAEQSKVFVESLAATAMKLAANSLMRSHDLTGAVFQRLIADRKFLAAYYTTPASAALLVGLAITPEKLPLGGAWSNVDDVKALRIADFACGTGTLLSSAYKRIGQLHELAGGESEALHPQMMATGLVGCDVLPAAAHLTASMLAGAHPTIKYNDSSILTVAYGKQDDPNKPIALGSLDLLSEQSMFDILETTAQALEGTGEAHRHTKRAFPHNSFDIVIMNPPFTRPTGHEGKKVGVPNPMFAAFNSDAEEQGLMGKAFEKLSKGTSAHGNAGEASLFMVLADRKLKLGGTLALIMPLSLVSGEAWEDSRKLLRTKYSNLIIISIAAVGGGEMSFSADTGMGECAIVGHSSEQGSIRATFVILNTRPNYPVLGLKVAEEIRLLIESKQIRRLEDGPIGGTSLYFGKDMVGQVIDAPLPESGSWNLARISDMSLAQTAYQLVSEKRLWLSAMKETQTIPIPMTSVEKIGKIGPYHADINGQTATGGIRGPFIVWEKPITKVPSYPILWAHDAKRERTMKFAGEAEAQIKLWKTPEERAIIMPKAEAIWETASHCHFNRDFRFNSQSTAMQFTHRLTLGGRAWLSIQLSTPDHEKALVAWANTTLGLLMYWWHANKQQSGRGSIGKVALQTLPILDVTALTPEQLAAAVAIFDEMCEKPLLPVHEIHQDPVRQALDEQFGRQVLGLPDTLVDALGILRQKLSQEPSIRGSK